MLFRKFVLLMIAVFVSAASGFAQEEAKDKPLTAAEARMKDGQNVFVEITIQSAKNFLADRGAVYLDSEKNFRDETNIAITITKAGAADLKKAGIDDPAEHFKGKTVRVRGTLTLKDKVARIEVKEAKQIELVTK
jgi:hypothetical protein